MVRGLTLSVALALGTVTVPAHALGLGDINTKSALNQVFKADIDLLSVARGELDGVKVRLADQDVFEKAGMERPFFLTLLKFRPERLKNGRAVIHVSSDFPIREPFLDFLVEVNWPRGHLIREYTVLLDPPAVSKRRPPVVQVAPAGTASAAPAPVKSVSEVAGGEEYGPVAAQETLWSIAKKLRPRGASMAQMMIALQRANPQAFIDGDINRLRRGQVLRIPSIGEILAVSREEAQQAYQQAQHQWRADKAKQRQKVAKEAKEETQTKQQPQASARAASAPSAELRIATARPEGEGEAGASEDRGDETVDALKQKLLLARENAESSRVESETLRAEITDLQKRLEDMQRLLSLKDAQLAQLQASVIEQASAPNESAEQAEAGVSESPASEQELSGEPGATQADRELPGDQGEKQTSEELPGEPEATQADDTDIVVSSEDELLVASEAGTESEQTDAEKAMTPGEEPARSSATPVDQAEKPGASATTSPVSATTPVKPSPEAVTIGSQLQELLLGDKLPYFAGGLGVLVLLLILLVRRRGGKEEPVEDAASDEISGEPSGSSAVGASAQAGIASVDAETDDSYMMDEATSNEVADLDAIAGESDPVSEADVYIAYGRYQKAEALLRGAIERDPQSFALQNKLAEVFYATRNKDEFNALAERMAEAGQDIADPEAWARICDMGQELDSDNPLYTRSAEQSPVVNDADVDAEGVGIPEDNALGDLAADLDHSTQEMVAEQGASADTVDEPLLDMEDIKELENLDELEDETLSLEELESLELDIPELEEESGDKTSGADLGLESFELPSLDQDSVEIAANQGESEDDLEAQLEELSDLASLDTDLGQFAEDISDRPASETEAILDKPLSIDEAFEQELDSDVEALDADSLTADTVDIEAVETKLDLAKAFVEMGDGEGARDILEEVLKEGNGAQREEAERLLADIG